MIEDIKAMEKFISYVDSFYGKSNSLYGERFFPSTGGVTELEIILATLLRIISKPDLPFDGDSIDREEVRDILLNQREDPT